MRIVRILTAVLWIGSTGCSLVSTGQDGIDIVPELAEYVPEDIAVVEIRNHSDRTVYLKRCTAIFPEYEVRRVAADGTLEPGYAPACSGDRPSIRILPETAVVTQLRIRALAGRGQSVVGSYRIDMGLYHDEAAVSMPVPEGAARSRVIRLVETRTP